LLTVCKIILINLLLTSAEKRGGKMSDAIRVGLIRLRLRQQNVSCAVDQRHAGHDAGAVSSSDAEKSMPTGLREGGERGTY
jgi:hypothetical protein